MHAGMIYALTHLYQARLKTQTQCDHSDIILHISGIKLMQRLIIFDSRRYGTFFRLNESLSVPRQHACY